MLFAVPFQGQKHPAFVIEGDRFGDEIRVAGEVRPPESPSYGMHITEIGQSSSSTNYSCPTLVRRHKNDSP
jgi:hypothetical protein